MVGIVSAEAWTALREEAVKLRDHVNAETDRLLAEVDKAQHGEMRQLLSELMRTVSTISTRLDAIEAKLSEDED